MKFGGVTVPINNIIFRLLGTTVMKQLEVLKFRSPKVKSMMAQYPDVFIMTFSPNFVLLSQTAQLLLIFCYAAPLVVAMQDW